jgi:hypothetical protein
MIARQKLKSKYDMTCNRSHIQMLAHLKIKSKKDS